ncbi:MAG: M48 family metalloprotease [Fimbriimonadaceae bacterium]|nr:M48 family metalloprotease [Fimbriimonadaceae bacterium]
MERVDAAHWVDGLRVRREDLVVDPPEPAATPTKAPADEALTRDIEADIELGNEYAKELAKELKFSEDAEMVERVRRIGDEMADLANARHPEVSWGDPRPTRFPYEFFVIQGDDVNAFSIPGGKIYINEGLVRFAESDDELAGVIGHEIAHAAFRHVAVMRRQAARFDLVQIPLILAAVISGSREAMGGLTAVQMARQSSQSGWSLNAERSADWGGLQYMVGSPYDPVGMLTFMERLAYIDKGAGRVDWGIFATHPPSRERAEAIRGHLRSLNVPIRRSRTSTTLRATSRIGDNQDIQIFFGDRQIHSFRGEGAIERSEDAVRRLNFFFDQVPSLDQVARNGYKLFGGGRMLFEVRQEDMMPDQDLDAEFLKVLETMRAITYGVAFRLSSAAMRSDSRV